MASEKAITPPTPDDIHQMVTKMTAQAVLDSYNIGTALDYAAQTGWQPHDELAYWKAHAEASLTLALQVLRGSK